jgi:L-alanine-DL-glutamate epimerase-like enolase superfamily enzyme
MMRSIPPRLRAPVYMLVGGTAIDAIAVAAWGWRSLTSLGPITVAAAVGYYLLAGRDSDFAAMLRDQADERQAYRRLKIQALVGRVTTGAAAVAYLAASLAKATLWPFAIFVAIPGVTFLAGWLVYREHPGAGEQQVGH